MFGVMKKVVLGIMEKENAQAMKLKQGDMLKIEVSLLLNVSHIQINLRRHNVQGR